MIEPTTYPRLRPLSIGDLMDEGVRLYRRNWLQLVTLAAIFTVPNSALGVGYLILNADWLNPARAARLAPFSTAYWLFIVSQWVYTAIAYALYGLMMGAMVYAAGRHYLNRPVTTQKVLGFVMRRLPVMAGVYLLLLITLVVLSLALVVIVCIGWVAAPPVIAFVMTNLTALIVPILMLEDRGALASMRRSWLLTKSQFWRIVLVLFVLYLFNMAIASGPTLLASVLAINMTKNMVLYSTISVGSGALIGVVFTPIWGVCLTLLYYDTRVRREAFDLALIVGDDAPPDDKGPLLIRSDWATLGILLVGTWAALGAMMVGSWLFAFGMISAMRGGI